MGRRLAVIHCQPAVSWQGPFASKLVQGLHARGLDTRVTEDRMRHDEGFPILLGTTFWRGIEADGGPYLLVDRCSFGDTNRFVSLVWNGHGRRGQHYEPENPGPARWAQIGVPIRSWKPAGSRVVLCGQTESYSPNYPNLHDWYRGVHATHFRRHPAGTNPTGLPEAGDFADAIAVTLNSSIGVQCVLDGIPTITMDEGSMAWEVTGHALQEVKKVEREPWAWRLAWTQWSHQEIQEGTPWAYLL